MRRDADAGKLLHGLLDRVERRPERTRRIMARPAQGFAGAAQRDALAAGLAAAADAGAVTLEMDRDAPHLVARVVLADPDRLYSHLGRIPAAQRDADALGAVAALVPATEVGRGLLDAVAAHWRDARAYVGLSVGDVDGVAALLRVADAAFTPLTGGPLPLRTRSARLLGDSKAMERGLSRLLAHLRHAGALDDTLGRDEALGVLGLSKFPRPFLVAGPLTVASADVAGLSYLGVAPEDIGAVALSGPVTSVMSVENLESFQRQVREARGEGDVVVYCGGFPAQGVVHALRHLVATAGVGCLHHWGDIDAGGVRIGRYVEEAVGVTVVPHLMDAATALTRGRPVAATPALATMPDGSAFAPLARFLADDGAHALEQETLDPVPPGVGGTAATVAHTEDEPITEGPIPNAVS